MATTDIDTMMLSRHIRAAAAVGQSAKHIITPYIPLSAPRHLARDFRQPATTLRTQTRLNSSTAADGSKPRKFTRTTARRVEVPDDVSDIPNLSPPWKFMQLHWFEREAYHVHGPNYIEHLKDEFRQKAEAAMARRAKIAREAEAAVGPNWHAVLSAYNLDKKQQRAAFLASIAEEKAAVAATTKNLPIDTPRSEINDLEQKKMSANAAINSKRRKFFDAEKAEGKEDRIPQLKRFAETMQQQEKA